MVHRLRLGAGGARPASSARSKSSSPRRSHIFIGEKASRSEIVGLILAAVGLVLAPVGSL
jgi:hypothetical protein